MKRRSDLTLRMHVELGQRNADMAAELLASRAALRKIDAIRNSIIGRQSVNWSMHIYPLVAALDEAGFPGEGYDVASAKVAAETERWIAAEMPELAAERERVERLRADLADMRDCLDDAYDWAAYAPDWARDKHGWDDFAERTERLLVDPSGDLPSEEAPDA